MRADHQSIAPPFPLKNAEFIDGRPAYSGTPFIIGFVDNTGKEDCAAQTGWEAFVHELPERANRWSKRYASLNDATKDALLWGLLTTDAAEGIHQLKCLPGMALIFGGLLDDPEASLSNFQPRHGQAVDTWESLAPLFGMSPLVAIAPATESVN